MDFENAIDTITIKVEGWIEAFISMLPNMVIAVILFILFLGLGKLARKITFQIFSKAMSDVVIQEMLSKIVYALVVGLGIFFMLEILKLHKAVTSLLAGIGVLGLALGFAFQEIAANFISGIILAFRKPFVLEDVVECNNMLGIVVRTNLRSTVIKTYQGQEIYIPNKDVLQNPIVNYSILGKRRMDIPIGVSYGDDLNKVEEVVLKTIGELDFVIDFENTIFDYYQFDDFSINFYIRIWVDFPGNSSYIKKRSRVIKAIKQAFDENNITIPFPIRTLDFGIKGGEKLSDMNLKNAFGEKRN